MENNTDRLLNVEQVRSKLACSRSHVYNLIERGELAAVRIGTRQGLRIKQGEISRFLNERVFDAAV